MRFASIEFESLQVWACSRFIWKTLVARFNQVATLSGASHTAPRRIAISCLQAPLPDALALARTAAKSLLQAPVPQGPGGESQATGCSRIEDLLVGPALSSWGRNMVR